MAVCTSRKKTNSVVWQPPLARPIWAGDTTRDVLVNANHRQSQGGKLQFVFGVLVAAEIHLDARAVIEYLFSPVQKIAHEAEQVR